MKVTTNNVKKREENFALQIEEDALEKSVWLRRLPKMTLLIFNLL